MILASIPCHTLRLKRPQSLRLGRTRSVAVDAVLLSHDQHSDNLDTLGRAFLQKADRVFTTEAGATGLAETHKVSGPGRQQRSQTATAAPLDITATPARHGPIGIEPFSGDVVGFVVSSKTHAFKPLYMTGDTVWFEGVAEVQRRFEPGLVLLFGGAAQTRGKFNLTMNANDAIEAAAAFKGAAIVPIHTDGWAHFTESGDDLEKAFRALGHSERFRRLQPGVPAVFEL